MQTKTILSWMLFLAAAFGWMACSKSNSDTNTEEQAVNRDIAYGNHAQQKMDIYLPAGRNAQTPLIVFLHGGGFVAGDKADLNSTMQLFVAKGYAVANINYRLVDSVGLTRTPVLHQPSSIRIADQLSDIKLAVDKITTLVPGWNISTTQWIVAGHSAGATLALLYAHGAGNENRRLKAAANFAGAITFAFSDESEAALLDPVIKEVLYRATGFEAVNANKLAYMAISPYWVSNGVTNGVPVINIRPSADSGDDLYRSYATMLSNKNIVNQYTVIQGAGHGFDPDGKWLEAITTADVFLQANGF